MHPLPFQGFKLGEFASKVHENPTSWHTVLFGMHVGKPQNTEELCREILMFFGYTLAEIRDLHECYFDITAYFQLTEGSPEEKTSSVASSSLPSSSNRHEAIQLKFIARL